jgi:hypothetical protein
MGRERRTKGRDPSRDSGPFIALPWQVTDSPAYIGLSHPAKALLVDIARQFVRDNNGRLLASRAYLGKRGWKSADTISRAVKELIAARLIHQTVMGHFPKTASWYAVTWRTLDRLPGFDAGAADSFERGAYAKHPIKNARLRPPDGQERGHIAPPDGQGRKVQGPPDGPIKGLLTSSPRPPDGHHLDKPSTGDGFGVNNEPGNYKRLTMATDSGDWLPDGLVGRESVPQAVTRKAAKYLANLPRGAHDAQVIQAGRGAGLTIEQLSAWADPQTVAQALAGGTRPWRDLWTVTITPPTLESQA